MQSIPGLFLPTTYTTFNPYNLQPTSPTTYITYYLHHLLPTSPTIYITYYPHHLISKLPITQTIQYPNYQVSKLPNTQTTFNIDYLLLILPMYNLHNVLLTLNTFWTDGKDVLTTYGAVTMPKMKRFVSSIVRAKTNIPFRVVVVTLVRHRGGN